MTTLTKNNLHLMGSASTIEALKELILGKLYWSRCDVSESAEYVSRLGKCYDVGNANGRIGSLVIIEGRRAGLYSINY